MKTLLLITLLSLAACSSSTGWEVKFALNPITQVDNHQGLVRSNGGAIVPVSQKERF